MKKLLVGLAMSSLAGAALAGEYHSGAQLVCSDCHTMHDSRSHAFNSNSDGLVGGLGIGDFTGQPSVGNKHLLVQSTVEGTCLACHDGQTFAPDVYAAGTAQTSGATGGRSTPGKRSAGALNSAAGAVGAYTSDMGHSMGATVLPPGFSGTDVWTGAAAGFSCADCHTPHGNAGYRNLVNQYGRLAGDPALTTPTPPTYVKAVAQDLTRDVTILGTTNSYDTDKIVFGNAAATSSKLNDFCGWCHGNFHGTEVGDVTDAGGAFIRHPTDGVTLGAANFGAVNVGPQFDIVRPIRSSSDAATVLTNAQVACVSCHKAHGNSRGFALIYPKWTDVAGSVGSFSASTDLEAGDDAAVGVRSLCVSCHPMGRQSY